MVARRWSIRDRLPRSGVVKMIYLEAETRDHGSDSDPGTLIRYRCGGSVHPQTDRPGCSAVSVVPGESSGCCIDYDHHRRSVGVVRSSQRLTSVRRIARHGVALIRMIGPDQVQNGDHSCKEI